jgi:hypothetical protein
VKLISIIALVLSTSVRTHAQVRESAQLAAPEAAMRRFVDAMSLQRWSDAAFFIDSSTFSSWLRDQISVARRARSPRRITAADLMRADSTMPRAVAEYQARVSNDARKATAPDELLLSQFANVPTVDSLARLSTTHAAARWLRAGDPRWIAQREIAGRRELGCELDSAAAAELYLLARPDSQSVVGAIARDTLAYVVVQQFLRDPGEFGRESRDAALQPRAFRMKRQGARWVLVDWEMWSTGRGQFIMSVECKRRAGATKTPPRR